MARPIVVAVVGVCMQMGLPCFARADDTNVQVSHIALADDGVTLCRHAFTWDINHTPIKQIDQPTADCWHIDFATGKSTPTARVPLQDHSWPEPPPAGARLADRGVDVCQVANPELCKRVALPDPDKLGLVATNAARTILAARKDPPHENATNIVTYDVATGKQLATFTAAGDIVQVLDDTLFVQASCAAPCGGTLYNARTGRRIAVVSDDIAAANDDNNNKLAGNIWQFNETAREHGEPGLLLEDVTTGRRVKRIARSALVRTVDDPSSDATALHVFPVRAGLLVIDVQDAHRDHAGDCAVIDRHGAVVKRFSAPAWPKP